MTHLTGRCYKRGCSRSDVTYNPVSNSWMCGHHLWCWTERTVTYLTPEDLDLLSDLE